MRGPPGRLRPIRAPGRSRDRAMTRRRGGDEDGPPASFPRAVWNRDRRWIIITKALNLIRPPLRGRARIPVSDVKASLGDEGEHQRVAGLSRRRGAFTRARASAA